MVDDDLKALLRPELSDLAACAPAEPRGVVMKMDANEAPPNESPAVRDAVARAVARVALERYPDPQARELKTRIAEDRGARE